MIRIIISVFMLALSTSAISIPVDEDALRKQLESSIHKIRSTQESFDLAMMQGEDRSRLCQVCHGEGGNSDNPDIPKLAGQNPAYIVDQFQRFADGRRIHAVMQNLAKGFTQEDMIQLAVYYQQQRRDTAEFDADKANAGIRLYQARCQQCHGADGMGSAGYANIAGQHPAYIRRTLTNFRDQTGQRQSDKMQAYTSNLSNEEIEALSHFIAQLGWLKGTKQSLR